MRVLVACEFSGTVAREFGMLGHDAFSVDLLPTEGDTRWYRHIVGDALEAVEKVRPDLLIAHPPCTYLTNAGARWLYQRGTRERVPERWTAMEEGAAFFRALLDAPVRRVAVENPVMVGHAKQLGIGEPSQVVQPWWFGHMEVKATCLWLRNLPPLVATEDVRETMLAETTYAQRAKVHHASPGPDRWKLRSLTYPGLAKAMAAQWGVEW